RSALKAKARNKLPRSLGCQEKRPRRSDPAGLFLGRLCGGERTFLSPKGRVFLRQFPPAIPTHDLVRTLAQILFRTPSPQNPFPIISASGSSFPMKQEKFPPRPAAPHDDAAPAPFTPVPLHARRTGWTPERQVGFIEALA